MRFRRQTSGEDVRLPWDRLSEEHVPQLMDLFVRRYEELYGRGTAYVEAGVDVSAIRVDAVAEVAKPGLRRAVGPAGNGAGPSDGAVKGTRAAWFGTGMVDATVYELDRLVPGARIRGPAIVESPFTTVLLPPSWEADLDPYGGLVMRR
jgi:N-methylhydantoinase A/oxoprolinase/acetone carboxylase beta subunit